MNDEKQKQNKNENENVYRSQWNNNWKYKQQSRFTESLRRARPSDEDWMLQQMEPKKKGRLSRKYKINEDVVDAYTSTSYSFNRLDERLQFDKNGEPCTSPKLIIFLFLQMKEKTQDKTKNIDPITAHKRQATHHRNDFVSTHHW